MASKRPSGGSITQPRAGRGDQTAADYDERTGNQVWSWTPQQKKHLKAALSENAYATDLHKGPDLTTAPLLGFVKYVIRNVVAEYGVYLGERMFDNMYGLSPMICSAISAHVFDNWMLCTILSVKTKPFGSSTTIIRTS